MYLDWRIVLACNRARWSVFMLGATYGHIYQTLREGNYAPYNFLTIFSDGFIALWLLGLLYLYYRSGGFKREGVG
jgi:hypothetical protein